MIHKAIAIIPARGGSKRIPRKNLQVLGGKPLVVHSILSALESPYLIDSVYASTEDKQIAKIAKIYGAKIIERPMALATDTATTLSVIQHAIKELESLGVDFDTVVLLQATCPFRKTSTIDRGLEKFWKNWSKYKSLFSVRPSKFPPNWLLKINGGTLKFILPNNFSRIRTQDLDKSYEIDGVLSVHKKDQLKKSKKYPFARNRTGYIFTNKMESIDIDDVYDLKIARALML